VREGLKLIAIVDQATGGAAFIEFIDYYFSID